MGCAKDSANWEAVSKSVLRGTERVPSSWPECRSSTREQWPVRRAPVRHLSLLGCVRSGRIRKPGLMDATYSSTSTFDCVTLNSSRPASCG